MSQLHLVSSNDLLNVVLDVAIKELVTVSVDIADSAVKAIKVSHCTDCVGTHVNEIEPLTDLHERHLVVLADSVDRVASGTKDGGLDDLAALALVLVAIDAVGDGVLVIKEDAVEGVVDALVDVEKDLLDLSCCLVADDTTAVDLSNNSVAVAGKETTRLCDELCSLRELGQNRVQMLGDVIDGCLRILLAKEATADIKEMHVLSMLETHLKDLESISCSSSMSSRVRAATADVVGDTDDLDVETLCSSKDVFNVLHVGTKLG